MTTDSRKERIQKLEATTNLLESAMPLIQKTFAAWLSFKLYDKNERTGLYKILTAKDFEDLAAILVPVIKDNSMLISGLSNYFSAEEMNSFADFLAKKETHSTVTKFLSSISSEEGRQQLEANFGDLGDSLYERIRGKLEPVLTQKVQKICTQQNLSEEVADICKATEPKWKKTQ